MPEHMDADNPRPVTANDFNVCPVCRRDDTVNYSFKFVMHAKPDVDRADEVRVTEPVFCSNCGSKWEDTWVYEGRKYTDRREDPGPRGP